MTETSGGDSEFMLCIFPDVNLKFHELSCRELRYWDRKFSVMLMYMRGI
jgi:hypothetical protein